MPVTPHEALARLTTTAMTTASGRIYFFCRFFELEGSPAGSIFMPDEESDWAEWLFKGNIIAVERLYPNQKYEGRLTGTAKTLPNQTQEIKTLVAQSIEEDRDHSQTVSMPKASKDPALKDAIDSIASATGQKPSQVVRHLCWEAICSRRAIASANEILTKAQ